MISSQRKDTHAPRDETVSSFSLVYVAPPYNDYKLDYFVIFINGGETKGRSRRKMG